MIPLHGLPITGPDPTLDLLLTVFVAGLVLCLIGLAVEAAVKSWGGLVRLFERRRKGGGA